jgi:hypothetical protein
MSESSSFKSELHALEEVRAPGKIDQSPEDRCAKLVTTLENCERQLKTVRLELTELKRTGPREEFARLRSNRPAIERQIETVGSLVSSCSASWKAFASSSEVRRTQRPENCAKLSRRLRLAQG